MDQTTGKIVMALIANPDAPTFGAHVGVLAALPDKTLNSVFAAIGKSCKMTREKFDSAIKRARMDLEEVTFQGLPIIKVNNRSLNDATKEVIAALEGANTPPVVFRRGDSLVTVRRDQSGAAVMARYDPLLLRSRMARTATFAMYGATGQRTLCAPPMDFVNDVLKCDEGNFPLLKGITNVPPLHANGSVRTEVGYDPATQLYYQTEPGFQLGLVSNHPVRADAERAAIFIKDELLNDFPFASEADLANAFGALLTVVLRPSMHLKAPLITLDSPSPGSGKSLLASAIAAAGTGERPAMYALPDTEPEVRKGITTMVDTGARVVIYDNVSRTVRSPALSSLLTADVWEDRLLGTNTRIKVPQQAVWFATGNNMSFSREMARRVCRIKIDPKMAHPETRTGFKRKDDALVSWVLRERGAVVAALITMTLAWMTAGSPKATVPRIGSFDVWAETIGGILDFAGVKGFLENLTDVRTDADEESEDWEAFLTAWARAYGDAEVSARSIADDFMHKEILAGLLPEELGDPTGVTLGKRLGKALARKAGTRFGQRELRVERGGIDSHTRIGTWRVAGNLDGLRVGPLDLIKCRV
ncbi:MAG: hypothetical protein ABI759_10870 [Candidatus Solibacter sp.]